ncbi:GAF domain-containing protein [Legionella drancourtii]|nr:GAF domain-containing protein [Legionella drancourtii]
MMDQIHKLQQSNLKILTLIRLGFNLLNERDPLQMLKLFSHTTCRLMQAKSMTVGIIEDSEHLSGKFHTTTIKNEQIDSHHSNTCLLNDAILRPLYYGQNILHYSKLSSSLLNDNNQMNTFSNSSFLGVPIRSSTQTHGVIYFIGKHNESEFNEEDRYIAEIMAAELALLYENIKVHDTLQQYIYKLQLEIIDLKDIEIDLRYKEERIKLALEVDQMKLAQIACINSMGEITSTLAHELNQPLTVINAYICGCLRRIENGAQEITPIIEAMIKVKQNAELAEETLHRMKEFVHKGKLQYDTLNIKVC